MRRFAVILTALCSVPAGAHILPDSVVDSRDVSRLAVTVYPDDLAMVTEVRTIDIPAGTSEIRLHGVSDMIVPETAVLQNFEGLRLEGNFNSDLISKGALLQKAVGQTLTIRRLNPGTGQFELSQGELVSASNMGNGIQGAVFKTDAGVEALQCAGLSEAVIFSDLPDSLNPVPVLSMAVSAEQGGRKEITLTYLTRGLGWAADYRMDVKDGSDEAALLGWLTLKNQTSKSFKNADVAVVAGNVNRAPGEGYTAPPRAKMFTPTCGIKVTRSGTTRDYGGYGSDEIIVTGMRSDKVEPAPAPVAESMGLSRVSQLASFSSKVSVREATRENLGDYKLYRAPQPVSLEAMQTKQIAFLLDNDVEFEKLHKRTINFFNPNIYVRPPSLTHPHTTRVEYDIDNAKDGNLAKPLPSGTVRVMSEREDGRTVFIGEDAVDNLAVDLPFEVNIAESFLVTTEFGHTLDLRDDGAVLKLSTQVYNASDAPALAEIEFADLTADVIDNQSAARQPDDVLPTYRLVVPPESKADLTLDMAVKQKAYITHNLDDEFRKREGSRRPLLSRSKLINNLSYVFKDSSGAQALLALSQKTVSEGLKFTSAELSRTDTEQGTQHKERFTFENLTAAPIDVNFVMKRDNGVTVIDASIPPEKFSNPVWDFTVPANSQIDLTVMSLASE